MTPCSPCLDRAVPANRRQGVESGAVLARKALGRRGVAHPPAACHPGRSQKNQSSGAIGWPFPAMDPRRDHKCDQAAAMGLEIAVFVKLGRIAVATPCS